MVWQIVTGRADAIGDHADRRDADRRDAALEARLDALQPALASRDRGQPLRLLAATQDGARGQSTAARITPEDAPRGNGVAVPSVLQD
ncbi:hypothetical protein QE400_000519 [Xanthomonas sacchari]|uniref:hypothetical protein n=1 Tax=Xanthomonas sacchari TaxID=56458 RepID=UPI00277DE7C9|nr:hypothetical protein [Xanthomonas sacchari]MDQ1091106.1 hypothetical protein [Xanthomonas sacchari]